MATPRSISIVVAVSTTLAAAAVAQVVNMDINSDLPYGLLAPGARGAGMGGAFTALADDSSAAYANPAGLLQVAEPEVAVEVRHQSFETPLIDGPGRYEFSRGELTTPPPYSNYDSESTGLSYLSYVHPGREWSFGVYRSEVSRFSIDAATEQVDAAGFREIGPRTIEADLDIAMYGAAAGWRALPRLWLGAAVTLQEFDYSAVQRNARDGDGEWGHSASGDDVAAAATFGVLWRPADAWRVGGSFRGGAEFEADYEFTCGTSATGARPAACRREMVRDGQPLPELSGSTRFKLPDVASIGVAWSPTPAFTASVEYDRIEYSQMLDGLRNSLTVANAPDHYTISDADDLHFGVEWIARRAPGGVLALRAGAWLESEHSLRYTADMDERYYRQEVAVALFSTPIEDEWHATAGVGFAAGARWRFDLAADLSKYRDAFVLSSVTRF